MGWGIGASGVVLVVIGIILMSTVTTQSQVSSLPESKTDTILPESTLVVNPQDSYSASRDVTPAAGTVTVWFKSNVYQQVQYFTLRVFDGANYQNWLQGKSYTAFLSGFETAPTDAFLGAEFSPAIVQTYWFVFQNQNSQSLSLLVRVQHTYQVSTDVVNYVSGRPYVSTGSIFVFAGGALVLVAAVVIVKAKRQTGDRAPVARSPDA